MSIVKINDIKLNYLIYGKGKPLILIAGLGVDNMCWIHQIAYFKKFFKVIVFDNRGIGKSSGSKGPYSIKMMANDVSELLNKLNFQNSHVLGSSMGGMIAQELAINYPDKIDKLILCSTFSKKDFIVEDITKGIKEFISGNVEDIIEVNPDRIIFEKLFNYLLQQIFSEIFLIKNRQFIEETWKRYLSSDTYVETFLKQLGAIRKHNTYDRLKEIKAPSLIITGTDDKLVHPENSGILAIKIPNTKLKKIENIGHGLHFEIPDLFNKIVIDFLLDKKELI